MHVQNEGIRAMDYDYQRRVAFAQLEVRKAAEKAYVVEQVRCQAEAERIKMREEAAQRRLMTFDELSINLDGEIACTRKSAGIKSEALSVINLRYPAVTIFRRISRPTEQVYRIKGAAGDIVKEIFLEKDAVGRGRYILRKMASEGICFKTSENRAKSLAVQLLSLLLKSCVEGIINVPEQPGWAFLDNEFVHFDEEDFTWENISRRAK